MNPDIMWGMSGRVRNVEGLSGRKFMQVWLQSAEAQ
jgi:hypothetical protein